MPEIWSLESGAENSNCKPELKMKIDGGNKFVSHLGRFLNVHLCT